MTETSTEPTTAIYVEYLYRGIIVSEASSRPVTDRDATRCAREAPAGAFAFRFYDEVTRIFQGSPLRSGPLRESGWYYIDAERLTAADVAALPGDYSVLLDNMRSSGWAAVARCRMGNFQPMKSGDVVISSETGRTS